ncbi:MAG: hemolysin III family protein [Candidatus Hydrogenedentes bacterium]|nr:hemolysin III family protein [Candidatus Hydrogenedentota bacterium]
MTRNHHYTLAEEIANAVTHGLGAVLSLVGLTALVIYAAYDADPWRIVSVSIFGATLILLYAASTLYHAVPHPPVKRAMRIVDHCAIYLLIAGTYTPFLLVNMRGPWGWSLFGVLWGIAVAGCVFKVFFTGRWDKLSTALYVAMGWAIVVALKPTLEMVPVGALILMLMGGIAYTGGTIFYHWDRLPFNHAIWHVCVMSGSATHYCAIFFFVLPVPTLVHG